MSDTLDLQNDLNHRQRQAVTHPARPLLILAGPGTGKTRVLTYRAAWLIEQGHAEPPQVLAVTFTNKAAEEMRLRLEALLHGDLGGLWAVTFHALALRLLREYAPLAGRPTDFLVFDENAQREVLIQACERMGWGTALPPRDLAQLRDFISYRKAHGVAPGYTADGADQRAQELAAAAQLYQDLLRESGALDFDDLIVDAAQMLRDHDDIRATVQARFRHVLVDEGHDMNPAQYALLQYIAPPDSSITVVADDNQSIYRWRGAEPRLIQRFRQDYQPQLIVLEETYRSTGQIVDSAQALIHAGRRQFPRALRAVRPGGVPIQHAAFQQPADEEAWLVQTIRQLAAEGHRYGDIAILYRTHDLANAAATALTQAQVPINRIQRENFFQQPGVQEVLRHLQLLRSFTDPYLRQAINFPRLLVDELTMLELRRLADLDEISLAVLSRQLDSYPEISPLTRAAVRDFLTVLDRDLLPLADQPINVIQTYLFKTLEQRRAPFHREELATLSGFAQLLPLADELARLRDAVDGGRPIALVAPRQMDALCAAVILQHALADYLHAAVSLHALGDGDPLPETDGLTVLIGHAAPPAATGDVLTLTVQERGDMRYALATVAWRLAASLLVSYETLGDSRFVVYDLETTGLSTAYDEIIQVGALTVVGQTEIGQPFNTLVRPKQRRISAEASKVHGLTWDDVKNAPEIDAVLPRLLRYFGDATLVGHNSSAFDNRFLHRDIGTVLPGRRLTNRTFDTIELARRLLPDQSHSLDALLRHYGIAGPRTAHQALADARLEKDVLFRLLDDDRWRKELLALPEMLPLVAIGSEASGAPLLDENVLLRQAAARVARAAGSPAWFDRVVDHLPETDWLDAQRHWTRLAETEVPETAEDRRWLELRTAWQEQVQTFMDTSPAPSLQAFLDYAALATNEDDLPTDAGRVTMMTLHNAKGKEFPIVIIIGADDGHIPDWRNLEDEELLEEERRVFYVGMTRAMDRLYLTSVTMRADGRRRAPSRFIAQLPRQHLQSYQARPGEFAPPPEDAAP